MLRKEGGRGLISVEDSVSVEISSLKIYVNSNEEALLCTVRREGVLKEPNGVQTMKEVRTERKGRYLELPLHAWSVFQGDRRSQNPVDLKMVKQRSAKERNRSHNGC